ncbi:hypothetical protein P7C73_g3883, partial [Tremellales sp. Uapishka_1]
MTPASFVLLALLSASTALAHCQLAWPYPLHSALNPKNNYTDIDYSMTSPLVTDGTYPCKGFIPSSLSPSDSVDTWAAGATSNYTIVGTATHGGGSCQLSMSYDLGKTWNVIFSQMGGCLIDGMTTNVQIPSEAPSGEALFSWSWFNLQGNREMCTAGSVSIVTSLTIVSDQNCAVITITDGGSGLTGPTPFVANAGSDINSNIAVVFPEPGSNVVYGDTYATSKPTTPAGFTGTNCVGPGASSAASSSSTPSSSSPASNSSSDPISSSAATSAVSSAAGSANPSATLPAPSSKTTLWSASIGADSGSSSASASASTSSAKNCKRKVRRSTERRHERLRRPRSRI